MAINASILTVVTAANILIVVIAANRLIVVIAASILIVVFDASILTMAINASILTMAINASILTMAINASILTMAINACILTMAINACILTMAIATSTLTIMITTSTKKLNRQFTDIICTTNKVPLKDRTKMSDKPKTKIKCDFCPDRHLPTDKEKHLNSCKWYKQHLFVTQLQEFTGLYPELGKRLKELFEAKLVDRLEVIEEKMDAE